MSAFGGGEYCRKCLHRTFVVRRSNISSTLRHLNIDTLFHFHGLLFYLCIPWKLIFVATSIRCILTIIMAKMHLRASANDTFFGEILGEVAPYFSLDMGVRLTIICL